MRTTRVELNGEGTKSKTQEKKRERKKILMVKKKVYENNTMYFFFFSISWQKHKKSCGPFLFSEYDEQVEIIKDQVYFKCRPQFVHV